MLCNIAILPDLSFVVKKRGLPRRVLAVNRWQIADTKTRVYLRLVVEFLQGPGIQGIDSEGLRRGQGTGEQITAFLGSG